MTKTCLLFCESFKTEIEFITTTQRYPQLCFATYHNNCSKPPLDWTQIVALTEQHQPFKKLIIIGGDCLNNLTSPPNDFANCEIQITHHCFVPLASDYTISELIKSGSYLITTSWLQSWKEKIEQWGFNKQTAPSFFHDAIQKIVYLDSGVCCDYADQLQELSTFADCPCEAIPVGMEGVFSYIDKIVQHEECMQQKQQITHYQKTNADYAITFELLKEISCLVNEQQVIDRIISLYGTLFNAKGCAYSCQTGATPGKISIWGEQSISYPELIHFETSLNSSGYKQLMDQQGFLFAIQHNQQMLGIVCIKGIAQAEYIRPYINLALSTADICGLALKNGLQFEQILTIGDELREQNKKLKKTHDELKNSQARFAAHEKMASLGQLSAGIAHEINTPIGYITSNLSAIERYSSRINLFTDQLLSQLFELNNSQLNDDISGRAKEIKLEIIREDMLAAIQESLEGTTRVKRIVEDLGIFCHSGEEVAQVGTITDCIHSALNIVHNELKGCAGVKLTLRPTPPMPCFPNQLIQVFVNLFTNAAHAIGKKGTISIESRVANNHIQIMVEDTGCGINDQQLSKIFDPFFTTKEVGKGTGLGLSISHGIIEKHGGTIHVASTVGKGSTFTIELPIALPPIH